ncbi:MAG: PAS domain S-box protein, partial [Chloroherpetonaceae bacterium]
MTKHDLRQLIPDGETRAKVLELFNAELEKRDQKIAELQAMLANTVETLHGDVREKMRLKEELKKHTDTKYKVAAELACDYIYEAIIDSGKVYATFVSSRFTELTGYTLDDINRNGWQHYIHPDDLLAVEEIIQGLVPHKPARFEYRVRCKDGRTIWLRDFSQPIFDENARFVKFIGFSREITAEKEASLALQRERQLLDTLLNTVPMGICLVDEDGIIFSLNHTWIDLSGYEKSELLGRHFSIIIPEAYREYAKEAHRTFMAGDSLITTTELPIQRKNGEERWVRAMSRKFQRDDGKWYRVTATEDITKEHQEREEKNQLLDLLARTEAITHIGSWALDIKTNRFTKWSDELFRIHERPLALGPPTAEEYVERYLSPESHQALQAFVTNLISENSQAEGEIELPIITHTGGHKVIRIRKVITIKDGQPVFAQGMTQDITREKMLEKQKEDLMKQLIQAQKLEAIGTLAGGIAHEFNNILAAMLGNVRLLEQKFAQEPKAKKYIDRLIMLNHRAATIVSQMLGFARQGKYELQSLSLKACVDNVSRILLTTTDRRIRFHLNTAADVPMIQGDPTQIEQVILNLAKNAIDAIEPLLGKSREQGHITFELRYEPIPEHFQNKLVQKTGALPMVLLK